MSADLRSLAARLGGEISGRGVNCPGPGHSANDRSLSVSPSATSPNGFLVYSFAGDDPIDCLDYVRAKLGLDPFKPQGSARPRAQPVGWHQGCARHKDTVEPAEAATQPPDNAAWALNIWRQAIDPRRTLVEEHLENRRLKLPDEAAVEGFMRIARLSESAFPRWSVSCATSSRTSRKPSIAPRSRPTEPGSSGTGKPSACRSAQRPVAPLSSIPFRRAHETLVAAKKVTVWEPFVWNV